MEAVGTVASIAGILSIAVQGINAIQMLHGFYRHCTDEAAQQFLHELSVSARILCDVKDLCNRSERHASDSRSQIRLASLLVQVEDCTADLETWLGTAKRIEDRNRFPRSRMTYNNPQQQFTALLNRVLRRKNIVATRHARQEIQERFQYHQRNVQTALAILQTEYHIFQTDQLQDLNVRTQSLVERSELHEEGQREVLSELRSSGSSILTWSMSHDARLRDVQSLYSQLSDKLETVLGRLSSSTSGVSSKVGGSDDLVPRAPDSPTEELYIEQKQLSAVVEPADSERLREGARDSHDLESLKDSEAEQADRQDLVALFDIYEDFHLIVRQYFDPIVVDYISTVLKWQALSSRRQLLAFVESDLRASQMVFDGSLTDLASSYASQLQSLRQRAQAESLEESLSEADALFGIGRDQVGMWQEITSQTLDWQEKLLLPNETDSGIKAKEHLTRTNEWLLEELNSTPYLAELHRTMLMGFAKSSIYEARTQWQRQLIKFWFLDAAATSSGSGYATSVIGMESELTVTEFIPSDDYDDHDIGAFNDVLQETGSVLKRLQYPALSKQVMEVLEKRKEEPPEGTSESCRSRAIGCLVAREGTSLKFTLSDHVLREVSVDFDQPPTGECG